MSKLKPKDLGMLLFEITDGKSDAEVATVMKSFVELLGKKRMIGKFKEISLEYGKIYNKANNITEATITLTNRLEENVRVSLREALKKRYQSKEVHMLEKVDARLLGGMKITVGDTVYDMSLKNTLNQLEAKLTA